MPGRAQPHTTQASPVSPSSAKQRSQTPDKWGRTGVQQFALEKEEYEGRHSFKRMCSQNT